jgi:acetyl-CoA C-acetyltransferase
MVPASFLEHYAFATQWQGAEAIAKEYGITREDTDRFELRSQELAKQAWSEGRCARARFHWKVRSAAPRVTEQ